METITKFISGHNRPGTKINVKGVIVHWTANEGNGADALANRNYFNSTDRYASAHINVDDHSMVECLPWRKGVAEMGYHVGASSYKPAILTALSTTYPNNACIGVEICVNADGDFKKTYANAVKVTAMMLKDHGLGISKLFRHNDVTGKNCPAFFVEDAWAKKYFGTTASVAYAKFRNDVNLVLNPPVVVAPAPTTYTVASGDSLWGIATKFGLTVDQLKALNGLTSDVINVGDKLIVKK